MITLKTGMQQEKRKKRIWKEKGKATQGGDTGGIKQIRGWQGRDKHKENHDMGS